MRKIIVKPMELEVIKYGDSYAFRLPKGLVTSGLLEVRKKYIIGDISEQEMGLCLRLGILSPSECGAV